MSPALGQGVQGQVVLRPAPSLILYKGLGGRPRQPSRPRAGAPKEKGGENLPPQVFPTWPSSFLEMGSTWAIEDWFPWPM